jgi:rhamnose transport system ATP-binding protein
MATPVLTLAHISKSFGGTQALADASLELYPGEVTALLGENGAGKSTLVKILAGLYHADRGEIRVAGRPVNSASTAAARALGISVVHQESVLFDNLSVAENILIQARPKRWGCIDWRALRRRASAVLGLLDAQFDPDVPVGALSVAQRHLVQIARGLSQNARVMVLDEPTAALSHQEAHDLQRVVQRLKSAGTAVLLISHRFEDVFALADRFVVLRDGRSVGSGPIATATEEHLLRLMVGRSVEQAMPPAVDEEEAQHRATVLRIERLSRPGEFEDVSFELRPGEILGVYGLVGAGRTELLQCLFGLTRAATGGVQIDEREARIRSASDAVRLGIAYVPEDRQLQGLICQFSIASNIALANLREVSWRGVLVHARAAQLAKRWIALLHIAAAGSAQRAADLSGGNQQKLVLAKWLATGPKVLLVDEPTKGIDVGTKAAVHRMMRDLAARGLAILMVSSDLPEVLGMSDRVLVMRAGRVRAHLTRADATAERLAQAATAA